MSQSLAEQVYTGIKRDILSFEMPPGSMIAQSMLAERYQSSITPIREALQMLAREGLIQSIPRVGYVVAPITLTDVQELFEVRLALEKAAVRLAAGRATPADIDRLAGLAESTSTVRDNASYFDFLAHNRDFHLSIVQAGGNRRLVDMITLTFDQLNRVFFLSLDIDYSAERMRAEHLALVDALRRKDEDAAERIVEEQISRSKQRVLAGLLSRAGVPGEGLGQVIQVEHRRLS